MKTLYALEYRIDLDGYWERVIPYLFESMTEAELYCLRSSYAGLDTRVVPVSAGERVKYHAQNEA